MSLVRNCECKCQSCSDFSYTCAEFESHYEDVDTADHCTAASCMGNHIECDSAGINEGIYHNCVCGCCHPPEDGSATACTNYEYFPWHAPSERHCTAAMCSSRNSECPDAGAHNEHGVVEA